MSKNLINHFLKNKSAISKIKTKQLTSPKMKWIKQQKDQTNYNLIPKQSVGQ